MADGLSFILKSYKGKLTEGMREACREITARTVTRTPVDTGALRKAWTPNIESNALMPGEKYVLSNNLPYARRIEYEGHSPQAPDGMMRRSVAEWRQIVKESFDGS